ncbi:unnamed protein product [Parascedosporium putredinis]|uniref:Uncharacterized protein n=1 Tax=Parascedosporium putredinis TaxID=1442378 RepID=A0A9P1M9A0_9PEZI|nr:unnamed protein product [Parascedosporium putredinis]CAI7991548.1 unnamed protein product [Parascedosporium putredinis]
MYIEPHLIEPRKLKSREITGLVIGVVAAVFIIAALSICLCFRRPRARREEDYVGDTDSEIVRRNPSPGNSSIFGMKKMGKKDQTLYNARHPGKGVVYSGFQGDDAVNGVSSSHPPRIGRRAPMVKDNRDAFFFLLIFSPSSSHPSYSPSRTAGSDGTKAKGY